MAVVIDGSARPEIALSAEGNGYFSGSATGLGGGGRYRFRLDDQEKLYPDPASRFQPEGPCGPSEVIEPRAFVWKDDDWRGVSPRGQVIYELHVGTFTAEGTYAAAAERLESLSELGVTLIELMPLADAPGRFGWGYDGVNLWAPNRLYGRPDDLRRFVAAAHAVGIGVILDVVYNHIGPNENYLGCFSSDYFTDRYQNEWGDAINFDGNNATPSREFFIENAGYWIEEFHLDGLRLDATQADVRRLRRPRPGGDRPPRAGGRPGSRDLPRFGERDPGDPPGAARRPTKKGFGLDALWNDDFHHTALVALTGHNEAYYTDYRGSPQELLSAMRWGFLYQGQHYKWQKQRRGTPALDLAAERFVLYLENHDQVANSGLGARLSTLTAPDKLRAMTALLLLAPGTPMLFQGQEFGSTRPFVYFADHDDELARAVAKGRREFLAQFPSLADPDVQQRIPDPAAPETFASCKLDWSERDRHGQLWDLHRDLLRLRREDPAFAAQDSDASLDGGARRRGDAAPLSVRRGRSAAARQSGDRPSPRRRARAAARAAARRRVADALVERGPALRRPRGGRRRDRRRVSPPRTCRGGPRPGGARVSGTDPIARPVRIGWRRGDAAEALVSREWLLTNGLGGYACGHRRRRAHPALPQPAGRRPPRARRPHHPVEPARRDAAPRRRHGHRARRFRAGQRTALAPRGAASSSDSTTAVLSGGSSRRA